MSTNPSPFGQRLEELIKQVESELRNAVTYVNDAVVPQARRESISAMRALSDKLRSLADRLEGQTPREPRP